MNKRYLMLGMFAFLFIACASAAIVNYLSNTASVDVDVQSPFSTAMSDDGATWVDTLTLPGVFGGDTISIYTEVTSLTSVDANVDILLTVTNSINNVSCDDFSNVVMSGSNSGLIYSGPLNLNPLCVENVDGSLTMEIPAYYNSGESEVYDSDWTFDLSVAPADYNFTVQAMTQ